MSNEYVPMKALVRGLVDSTLFTAPGQLRTTRYIPRKLRRAVGSYHAYRHWADIALTVAAQFPDGDYFEFGSSGFNTLRNFLSALHLYRDIDPDMKFFTFDAFGEYDGQGEEQPYFQVYKNLGTSFYERAMRRLRRHGIAFNQIEITKGYFADTLTDALKQRLKAERRRAGFAFLDCSMAASYETCFGFLEDFVTDRAFVYVDEYFQIPGVAEAFEKFRNVVCQRHGLVARYVRDCGGFGALFVFNKSPQ
jgi:hypothetical protein